MALGAPVTAGCRDGLSQAGCPQLTHPCCRALAAEESAWGEDEEAAEHDYYNSIPGKEPPPGGLVDSRLRHSTALGHVRTQPSSSVPPSQVSPSEPLLALLRGSQEGSPNLLTVSSSRVG